MTLEVDTSCTRCGLSLKKGDIHYKLKEVILHIEVTVCKDCYEHIKNPNTRTLSMSTIIKENK